MTKVDSCGDGGATQLVVLRGGGCSLDGQVDRGGSGDDGYDDDDEYTVLSAVGDVPLRAPDDEYGRPSTRPDRHE